MLKSLDMVERNTGFVKGYQIEKRKLAVETLGRIYKFVIDEETREKLIHIKDFLTNNPDWNLILYFNHISFDDPVFILWLYAKYLDPECKRKIIFPVSHFHSNLLHNPTFSIFTKIGSYFFDFLGPRVIQTYQLEEREKYGYSEEDARKTNKGLIRAINNLKGGTFIISPEGHRSEDGTLKEGERGIEKIGRKISPAIFLPVGIIYEDSFRRNVVNFTKTVNLKVTTPLFFEGKEEEKITHEMIMRQLASILPENMKGKWI